MIRQQKTYQPLADFCQVLISAKRLAIIDALAGRTMSVKEISEQTKIRQSNLSQHLRILKEKGVINSRPSGVSINYFLVNPKIRQLIKELEAVLLSRRK